MVHVHIGASGRACLSQCHYGPASRFCFNARNSHHRIANPAPLHAAPPLCHHAAHPARAVARARAPVRRPAARATAQPASPRSPRDHVRASARPREPTARSRGYDERSGRLAVGRCASRFTPRRGRQLTARAHSAGSAWTGASRHHGATSPPRLAVSPARLPEYPAAAHPPKAPQGGCRAATPRCSGPSSPCSRPGVCGANS